MKIIEHAMGIHKKPMNTQCKTDRTPTTQSMEIIAESMRNLLDVKYKGCADHCPREIQTRKPRD